MNVEEILNSMSLKDKISLCSGKNFWETKAFEKYGIPSLFMSDGPHGLRKQELASDMLGVNRSRQSTCFPAEVTSSCSWDVDLLEEIGQAIAMEAKHQEVGLVLGPGANIKRNPLCGRNFEYFSEDPYLSGKLAAAFIKGMEKSGVSSSLKHFACNSQEHARFVSDGILDERTFRELYLSSFEIAIKEGKPSTVMCAYPKINGIHCSDNKYLLTDILRNEWNFDGLVITDWGAMNDRIEGFKAGCDLSMPGGSNYMEKDVYDAIMNGKLDEEVVNTSARRVLNLVNRGIQAMTGKECDYASHNDLCEKVASSSAVLLKNEENILPLKKDAKIAIIGSMAKTMRYQGAGSSHINPLQLTNPLDVFSNCSYASGCDEKGNTTKEWIDEARKVASQAEVAIVFAGLPDRYESEGFDRETMKLPQGHIDMIEGVSNANPNTVVVLLCGSVVECAWEKNVKAILYMGLPGQAGGQAISKLLYGEIIPSGKLSESWPYFYEDVPSCNDYGKTKDALYKESIYVGYRYYDKAGIPVRYPFGYGLSYTTFEYSNLSVCNHTIKVTITNTGKFDAAEIVQLYIKNPQNGIHRPIKELKGFKKVFLHKNESKEIEFTLDDRSFSIYQDGWKVPSGTYEVCIGNLKEEIIKDGVSIEIPVWQKGSFYDKCQGRPSNLAWSQLLGYTYIAPSELKKGQYNMECSVEDMKKDSLMMKIMYKSVEMVVSKGKPDYDDPEFKMMMAASAGGPIRSMCISGGINENIFLGMIDIANGHVFKGLIHMLKK